MDRETYTNEHLRKKFKSQFEMVNCAIHCAEEIIKRGTQAHDLSDKDNVALYVIDLIESDDPEEVVYQLELIGRTEDEEKVIEEPIIESANGKKGKKKSL